MQHSLGGARHGKPPRALWGVRVWGMFRGCSAPLGFGSSRPRGSINIVITMSS
jgi:hypothetical protein